MGYILKIKELLKKKNLTQRDFAKELDVTLTTVSNYLTKKTKIDIETFIKISKVLGVPMGYFFEDNLVNTKEVELLKNRITELEDKLNDKKTITDFYTNNTDMLISAIAQLISDVEYLLKQKNIDKKELHKTVGYKIYINFWNFHKKSIIESQEKRRNMLIEKLKK